MEITETMNGTETTVVHSGYVDVNGAIMNAIMELVDRCGYATTWRDGHWTSGSADIVRALLKHPQVAFALRDVALDRSIRCELPKDLQRALDILDEDWKRDERDHKA